MAPANCTVENRTIGTINVKTYNFSDSSYSWHYGSWDIEPERSQKVEAAADARGLQLKISGNGITNDIYHAANGQNVVIDFITGLNVKSVPLRTVNTLAERTAESLSSLDWNLKRGIVAAAKDMPQEVLAIIREWVPCQFSTQAQQGAVALDIGISLVNEAAPELEPEAMYGVHMSARGNMFEYNVYNPVAVNVGQVVLSFEAPAIRALPQSQHGKVKFRKFCDTEVVCKEQQGKVYIVLGRITSIAGDGEACTLSMSGLQV